MDRLDNPIVLVCQNDKSVKMYVNTMQLCWQG